MTKLTDAQRGLAENPGDLYVEACPGAGKTRALVARYLRLTAQKSRKGVALLSFTNAAVDEARTRCKSNPELLAPPHFIGTFDSFINRFVVGPIQAKRTGNYPTFIESWDAHDVSYIAPIAKEPYIRFSLEWFDIDLANKKAKLDLNRVGGQYSDRLATEYLQRTDEIDAAAYLKWEQRIKRGYISCSASRILAGQALHHATLGPRIRNLLSARFSELIVDEAQDCGSEELDLLTAVREGGTKVVLVADPDQAIFEFRRATPDKVVDFAKALTQGQRLGDNFRSSPAICRINQSLRTSGHADEAKGSNASAIHPIILVSYDKVESLVSKFEKIAGDYSLEPADGIVISHRTVDAMKAVGASPGKGQSAKKALVFARAWKVLNTDSSTPRERLRATVSMERALLDLVEGTDAKSESPERLCEELGINHRLLRAFAMRLAMGLDASSLDPSAYAAELRKRVAAFDWGKDIALVTLSDQIKAPTADDWADLSLGNSPSGIRWSTIHGVKGLEFPWVALVLPKQFQKDSAGETVLDQWEKGSDSEARRVIYVGASRAQELLILAAHTSAVDRIEAILKRDAVPFTKL